MQNNFAKTKTNFSFWKKITFITLFFFVTPVALITSFLSLATFDISGKASQVLSAKSAHLPISQSGVQVYASLPSSFPSISGEVEVGNTKVGLLKSYLDDRGSPLGPFAEDIVGISDKYGLDYRLTTAIAQKESGLCNVIPEGSHNCWGWGIHSKGILTFNSYVEGVEVVSKGLKDNYIDQGYDTVEEIMIKYAHPSSTTWAEGVLNYMSQIE